MPMSGGHGNAYRCTAQFATRSAQFVFGTDLRPKSCWRRSKNSFSLCMLAANTDTGLSETLPIGLAILAGSVDRHVVKGELTRARRERFA